MVVPVKPPRRDSNPQTQTYESQVQSTCLGGVYYTTYYYGVNIYSVVEWGYGKAQLGKKDYWVCRCCFFPYHLGDSRHDRGYGHMAWLDSQCSGLARSDPSDIEFGISYFGYSNTYTDNLTT